MGTTQIAFRAPSPTLARFWQSSHRLQFVMGPVGSGKTSTVAMKVFKLTAEQAPDAKGARRTRIGVIRNTRSDLKVTTIPDFRRLVDDRWGDFVWGPPPQFTLRYSLPDNTKVESEIMFLGLDHEDDVRKIRGANWTFAWMNELKELNRSALNMVRTRVGRYPRKDMDGADAAWYGVIGDYNAPDEDHWLYEFVENTDHDGLLGFFRQPPAVLNVGTKENPKWVPNPEADNVRNLPENYYLEQISGRTDDSIRVELGNEYGLVIDGRPVYPDYEDAYHCMPFSVDPKLGLLLGWDFGLTPACIIAQLSPRGQLRYIDEVIGEDVGIKRFARDVVKPKLLNEYGGVKVVGSWGDPGTGRAEGNERSAIDYLNDTAIDDEDPINLPFSTEPSHTNIITRRVESVAGFLNRRIDKAPGMLVHPRCKTLRAGFIGRYAYRRVKISGREAYHDTPDKNAWSHPHDAAQYIAVACAAGMAREVDWEAVPAHNTARSRVTGY